MTGRLIQRAIISGTAGLILEDPEWARTWARYLVALQSGSFPQWYVDMILQRGERSDYTLYDAYAFSQVHTLIHTGWAAWVELHIGREPHCDADADGNNRALSFAPASQFRASFQGGAGPSDGWLEWRRPIQMQIESRLDITRQVTIQPRRVPLEVGFTEASTTLDHLLTEFGLARWPYGSESIWLMAKPDDSEDEGAPEPAQLALLGV